MRYVHGVRPGVPGGRHGRADLYVTTLPDTHALPELLTPTEAKQLLRDSRSWLYEAAKDGRIPAIRLGGSDGPVRFIRADLLTHIEAARQQWHPARTSATALRTFGRPAP